MEQKNKKIKNKKLIKKSFLANDYFPQASPQSRLSANDERDNEMVLGAVYRSSGIYLTAEENPEKPQLGDR